MASDKKDYLEWKDKIDQAIIEVCWRIIQNPLLYFSEADVQQMLVEELHGIDSLAKNYKTNVQKGEGSKARYETSLVHREYGAGGGQRFDIVILDPTDVEQINDVNLMKDGEYLDPVYAFELGTEKTPDVDKHFENDIEKLRSQTKMICGYLIYLYKDKTFAGSHTPSGKKAEEKIEEKFRKVVKKYVNGLPSNIKMLAVLLRTAKNQPRFLGKCEIFNGEEWKKVNIGKKAHVCDALRPNLVVDTDLPKTERGMNIVMGESSREIEADFAGLQSRLSRLEGTYNPDDENLHFANSYLYRADADLFDALLQLAQEGLAKVRQHHSYFSNPDHALYDDGMFWYDLCLLIKSAAVRVYDDKSQNAIPAGVIKPLTEVLVKLSEYTGDAPDMYQRNFEALAETLLAFYSDDLVALARQTSHAVGTKSVRFVEETISRINEIRQRKE